MANTYVKIASVTVGSGGASSIDFTSIPSTYTDLVVKVSARSSRSAFQQDDLSYRFNSSTSSIYNYVQIRGSGSAAISTNPGSVTYNYAGQINSSTSTSNTFSNVEIYIPNYAGSTNKSSSVDGVQENNQTEAFATLVANLWSSTAAITSISLLLNINSNNFLQYSTATLYGIKNS
jgi:hypothetical protein